MELDRLARENFVGWLADALREDVQDGAGWAMWLNIVPRFQMAEQLTEIMYPGIWMT